MNDPSPSPTSARSSASGLVQPLRREAVQAARAGQAQPLAPDGTPPADRPRRLAAARAAQAGQAQPLAPAGGSPPADEPRRLAAVPAARAGQAQPLAPAGRAAVKATRPAE